MTLKEFKDAMNKLKGFKNADEKFGKAFFEFTGGQGTSINGWREEFEIDLIKKLVDDKYDYIEYFVYDKNWGTDKKYNIYDEKYKVIPLNNLNNLYKAIKKQ